MTRRATVLRSAAAVVAAVAALGPVGIPASAPIVRVLLVDVSASVSGRGPTADEIAELERGLGAHDRGAVVAFAESAEVVAPPAAGGELSLTPPRAAPWGTSLAPALRLAESMRTPGSRLEILVATDARLTDDEASLASAARLVRDSGGAVVRALRRERVPGRSVVTDLAGPGRATVGEVVPLEARGTAAAGGATVELLLGGEILESRRVERPGPFRVTFARVADARGLKTWEARARESADVPRAASSVVVGEPGSVAWLHAGEDRSRTFSGSARIGAVLDLRATSRGDGDVARLLEGHDAVVVDDVPEGDPDVADCADALAASARAGVGVLFLGGERSFAAGGWGTRERGLEALSPLRSAPPGERAAALYLGIDGSGSMAEPWPAPGGAQTGVARDVAVRAAAESLAERLPPGCGVRLRRFRDRLVPDEAPPAEIELADDPARAALRAAVRALPPPGGPTAFLPVLGEAYELLVGSPAPTRSVVLLTDGRSSEDAAALRDAVRKLASAGIRLAIVLPGAASAADSDVALLAAVRAEGGTVRSAAEPSSLARELAAAERDARGSAPFVEDRALEPTADAAPTLGPEDVPARAARMARTWAAPDATVGVRATAGEPFAAWRREGAGIVGAVASRVGDPAWVPGDAGVPLAAAMLRAVRRRGARTARVETDGPTLHARLELPAGAPPPTRVAFGTAGNGAPLRREAVGVFAADIPSGPRPSLVRFLAGDGSEVVSAGLDRPAPREVLDLPEADLAGLAARMAPPVPAPGVPLRPALAALAVALLLAGSFKSGPPRAR